MRRGKVCMVEGSTGLDLAGQDVWSCTLDEFIDKVSVVLEDHQVRNNISNKVLGTAAGFLRIKFDNGELKYSVGREVSLAIESALIYYVNVLGEDI